MYYGQNYGNETLNREYKEFTFNHGGLEIDESEAESFVRESKWFFNNMIDASILKYLKIYLPKYTSAFLDEHSDVDSGEFYIGIADNGLIQGIPYQGTLDKKFIEEEINKILKSLESNNDLNSSIKVDIINIAYQRRNLNKVNDMYNKYLEHKKDIIIKTNNHKGRHKKWSVSHNRYAQRLVDIFNNITTKKELESYIKKSDPYSSVLNLIADENFKLETKNHTEINEMKQDITSPYYWVCKFKDEGLDKTRKKRPINNIKKDILKHLNPMNILIKVSTMIPWWMQNNENMNLFVIKISFVKNHNNNQIYYYDTLKRRNRYYRTTSENKPCCLPV